MICQICSMYSYTPQQALDLTLDQLFMFYDYGFEFEKTKALILVSKVGLLFGAPAENDDTTANDKVDGDGDNAAFVRLVTATGGGEEDGL